VVERNTNGASRMGSLLIAGKPVTVIQDGTSADTNTDGLPDSWQLLYFMNANSPNAAPDLDYDLDGMTNMQEYLSDTDPTDPASALSITAFSVARAEQTFQLAFPSVANHFYQVERTADLANPDWKGFTNAVYGTGADLPLAGTASTNAPSMFYRVQLVH
jgi:hypothetical protein